MGDRATLEKIFAIMRRLLLVPMDGANPIPRKGTTRHECYRALYEIQELLETRRYFGMHLPQTNADRIRAMTDEELANFIAGQRGWYCDFKDPSEEEYPKVLLWLKSPAEVGAEKCGFEP